MGATGLSPKDNVDNLQNLQEKATDLKMSYVEPIEEAGPSSEKKLCRSRGSNFDSLFLSIFIFCLVNWNYVLRGKHNWDVTYQA